MIGPPRHNSRLVCKTLIICLVRGTLPIHYRIIKYISGLPSRKGSLYFATLSPSPSGWFDPKRRRKTREVTVPQNGLSLCRLYPGGSAIL